LKLIEDAAELIGQTYRGRPCGSFGDISTFSFYSNKHITTGEGGMILTDDDNLAENCRALRNLCFQKDQRFKHERLGWNLRMTNIQAALGLAQLERLEEVVDFKRRIGKRYTDLLRGEPGIVLPLNRNDYAENIYWVYGLLIDDSKGFDADVIMARLAERGIGTRPFFYPMHQQPVLNAMGFFAGESYPVAERLSRRGLYLPSGLALSDADIEEVVFAFRESMA
jgi:perosamine synthetase